MSEEIIVSESAYQLKTPQFEGPLELLLELIEKRKLHINDFSLSQVADEYIAVVRSLENFPVSSVAQFLIVASALVLIKSKALLPQLDLEKQEEESIDDLKRRLMLYEKFRALGKELGKIAGTRMLYAGYLKGETPLFTPHPSITIQSLRNAITGVISELPKERALPEVAVRQVISLEEMMDRLSGRIERVLRISFSDFAGHGPSRAVSREEKINVVVGFLAMLELVKQGIIEVSQEMKFGEIHMESNALGTPKYGPEPS